MQNPDAICGNCGKAYKEHYHESYKKILQADGKTYLPYVEHFCFTNTNGDIFTDEPRDSALIWLLEETDKRAYNKLKRDWQIKNGHRKARNK